MGKRFNIAGPCISKKHYMVNMDNKLKKIESLIDKGDYFIINRPRQYGKTTLLSQIAKVFKEKYLIIRTSFEGIGDSVFEDEEVFSSTFFILIIDALRFIDEEKSNELRNLKVEIKNLQMLSSVITKFIQSTEKPVLLIIDEVDKASNNQLFLSFLGMLRNKYILSNDDMDYTFHSVILAGVHDVKNLKLRIRPDEERKYNSPWNIAVDFNVDMTFNSMEIETMLKDYSIEENVKMDTKAIAEKIYYYTSGYPFLVSKLSLLMEQNFKNNWIEDNIDKAVKLLLYEKNTLFDSLIKNLENNEDFKKFIEKIVLSGEEIVYVPSDSLISLGELYGFIKQENNICKIHNRIFEQYIYNHLTSIKARESENISNYNFRENFLTLDNGLDFEKVLLNYQKFMKEQYSNKDEKFIEYHGRLLFLAFIKPIINGIGFDFKEVQISREKRLDVVVTYNNHKYITELKIWHGEEYHKAGVNQLCDYLSIHSMDKGYLIVYNFNKNKKFIHETIYVRNKEIFIVYV
ncbi:energy-coupling factor transporter ATP-binding protein EcfA2 [Clostridium saccharoperbutylacetonicum]|uniref:Putative AAA-ATPase n=1 Tax=Clostridium saccharoperbutylacetonicum N1-4(HMT) TaxID=931276 RepID=M1MMM4_9CLOT|nr:AAA-like domain-containing protein [Clostridium saccharoperbutylacetonicum]AGF59149.1 putative AAA-ATPase [Clostridium saccharoperbutylacetonicum N1-4(HMT)]NRT60064.1 energy-coupling factor transporter ATP-binding protein EcfA2 [Clostridium saccharoperbutylacetonicum]NSB23376.1 energy-coupling factor transporter ATP-binding protein EcfA2 [Clostridium saccharoperbutylacetonicum]NSB42746.1 energy-coupling factor transporter ATP-binding protein EcfA2 [Clostridium saccharoperbutylacetonicum]